MTPQELLGVPLTPNDAGAATIRDYLIALLTGVWTEEEGFSGKRPFGNSSWKYDIYKAMISVGAIGGKLDQYGYVDELSSEDRREAEAQILSAIAALGG